MKRGLKNALLMVMLAVSGATLPLAEDGDATIEEPAQPAPAALELWDDPTLQKAIIGSYGFQSDIEPSMTTVEREYMQEILPLLSTDQDAAIARLRELLALDKPEPRKEKKQKKAKEPQEKVQSAIFDFTLANLYFQKEDLENAAKHYERAIERFPSFRRAYKNLGLIQVREGKFENAITSLSRVVELGDRDGLTMGLLGYSYGSTGQNVSAETAYRTAVLLQPDVLDWRLGLTQSVMRQRKFGEGVTLCEELILQDPDRADFWLLQANAYIGLGQPMKAAENFELVDRMGKASPRALLTLGDIYVNEGLWDLAVRAYKRSAEANPGDLKQPIRRVEVLAQRGALQQARGLLKDVQQLEGPEETPLPEEEKKKLLKLEARIAVAEGTGGAAVSVLEEIVSLDPLDGEALMLLGQHYTRVDDVEKAIFYYERASSIDEFEADANVRHAQLLANQSRYSEAVPLLRRAQEISPRDEVGRYLEQVERAARSSR